MPGGYVRAMDGRRILSRVILGTALVTGAAVGGGVPTAGAPKVLWTGGAVPEDLVQEPEPDLGTNIDAGARAFADVDNPGTVGSDGCASVTAGGGVIGFFLPKGENLPTRFTSGVLCDLGGDAQELRLAGETLSADQQTVVGTASARWYRTSPSDPFSRFDLELTDGRCFAVGSLSGYPGDGTAPDDYVMQGWNYDADPSVDCSSRSLPGPSTSTSTSSTTTTSYGSSTTSTSSPPSTSAPAAVPAGAVAGSPTYTG